MKKFALVYDEAHATEVRGTVIPLFKEHLKTALAYTNGLRLEIEESDCVVTYLSDDQLKEFIPLAIDQQWKIGFLPHPAMIYARRRFEIAPSLANAIANLLTNQEAGKTDILWVNGRPLFDTLVVGKSLSVIYGSSEATKTRRIFWKFKNFFKLFERVTLKPFTLEYKGTEGQKKQQIHTAALGLLIVQHGKSSLLSRKILDEFYANDGMMHVLVLAPHSILGLVKFGMVSLFRSKKNPTLPPFAGYIKTNNLKVLSQEAMDLSMDNSLMSAKEVELELDAKVLQVVAGKPLEKKNGSNSQEIYKVQALPRGELREELLRGPLPLMNHATTEQFKDLFTTLKENARPTSSYLVLMFLSTLIATLGLFSNSSPVVIGAMILAPLMAPIISLSMGVLRQDNRLIRTSLKAIALGMLLSYVCAILITWLTPITAPNVQIMARIRPNLLDLGIAVGSGIAGAYAHAKKEVAKTLAGVAIAVALVPPLSVSGIGIGWLNWNVFSGAFLLFITNLAGIVLAAALTFLLLGFSPFRLAKKGLALSLVFVLGISTPLAFGFSRMVRETRIIQNLNGHRIGEVVLREVEIRSMSPLKVSLQIITEKPLAEEELLKVKQEIEALMGEEVELEATIGITL